jgi:hypothetical protein
MVDIESWMPGRGELDEGGAPRARFGETHSASRLYDYQCRRLNMRYRAGGAGGKGETVFCHSLNNTVLASPRFLIPLLENHQNADGSVTIPEAPLRPYMGGRYHRAPIALDIIPRSSPLPLAMASLPRLKGLSVPHSPIHVPTFFTFLRCSCHSLALYWHTSNIVVCSR